MRRSFYYVHGHSLFHKSGPGISPVSSLPYVTSNISGMTVGETTIIINFGFVRLQAVILRKGFKIFNLLQIPVSVFFGLMIDVCGSILSGFMPQDILAAVGHVHCRHSHACPRGHHGSYRKAGDCGRGRSGAGHMPRPSRQVWKYQGRFRCDAGSHVHSLERCGPGDHRRSRPRDRGIRPLRRLYLKTVQQTDEKDRAEISELTGKINSNQTKPPFIP